MSLPSDNELTKLRIKASREKREYDRLHEISSIQYRVYETAWLAYISRCKKLGYCPICEKLRTDCNCTFLANNI